MLKEKQEQIIEQLEEYLTTSFTYNQLDNKKERKIYQSGFAEGIKFASKSEEKGGLTT